MSSLPMFEEPHRAKPRRKLAADPWARKLTVPEWKYIIRERVRGVWIFGVGVGMVTMLLMEHADSWVGVLFVAVIATLAELANWRKSRQ